MDTMKLSDAQFHPPFPLEKASKEHLSDAESSCSPDGVEAPVLTDLSQSGERGGNRFVQRLDGSDRDNEQCGNSVVCSMDTSCSPWMCVYDLDGPSSDDDSASSPIPGSPALGSIHDPLVDWKPPDLSSAMLPSAWQDAYNNGMLPFVTEWFCHGGSGPLSNNDTESDAPSSSHRRKGRKRFRPPVRSHSGPSLIDLSSVGQDETYPVIKILEDTGDSVCHYLPFLFGIFRHCCSSS